jgi:crossover junction endodeoxyribonuclease RuvC
MVILGIDPGLERVGYGVVRKEGSRLTSLGYGLVKTPKGETPERLRLIFDQVVELVEKFNPDCACCERLFFTKNQTTGIDVAKALGVVQLALAQRGLSCREFAPPEVKLAVVGNGAAEKRQVQYMVTKLLGLSETPKPDDVADALAVAVTGALKGLTNLQP